MIASLTGKPTFITPSLIVLNVSGVGYEVHITRKLGDELSSNKENPEVLLHTYHVVKEDEQSLYGFLDARDKTLFSLLTGKVQGIGPKSAMSILDQTGSAELQSLIAAKDSTQLSKLKGIGKKTAERIILDLGDLMGAAPVAGVAKVSQTYQDSRLALASLGFKTADINGALDQIYDSKDTVQVLIRKALVILQKK